MDAAFHVVSGRTIAWWIPNVWNIEDYRRSWNKKQKDNFSIYNYIYIVLFCIVISFTACLHIPYIPNMPVVEPQSSWFLTTSGLWTKITQKCSQIPRIFGGDADMERVELNLKSWFLVKGEARKNYIHNYTSYIAIYIYRVTNLHIYMWYSSTIGWKENLKGSRELRFLGLTTRVYCFLLSPIYWYIEYTIIYVSL